MPNILLLEDEALIALDVERTFADAEIGQTTSFASCVGALSWLRTITPDVAVIDIFLRDGECDEVAEILVARGVPLVIHSARRGVASDTHRVFLNGTWICKPSDPDELTRAVRNCLAKPVQRQSAATNGENLKARKGKPGVFRPNYLYYSGTRDEHRI